MGIQGVVAPGDVGSLPLQRASTSNDWEIVPLILEPTQYRLHESGPEGSLPNGAGLRSQAQEVLTPPDAPDPALPSIPAGRCPVGTPELAQ
jgi:hypothetical protein